MIPNFNHKQSKSYEFKITLERKFDRFTTLNIVTYCKHSKDMIAIISQHLLNKHKLVGYTLNCIFVSNLFISFLDLIF